jgi:hypothetical protein
VGLLNDFHESLRVAKEITSKASNREFCELLATEVLFPVERRLILTASHGYKQPIAVVEIYPAHNPTSEDLDFLGVLLGAHWS